jgi:hypothetical protein
VVDRHRERGAVRVGVVGHHGGQVQLPGPLLRHRRADDPAAVSQVEHHGAVRHGVCGHHEVALVLTLVVVRDDDHPPAGQDRERLLDRTHEDASCLAASR